MQPRKEGQPHKGWKKAAKGPRKSPRPHQWTDWKEIGRTGDWFHPLIVERKCLLCGATETDEH